METASIYVRLSKAANPNNASLAGMVADCEARAARLGATVVDVHVDDGVSGAVRDRPELLAWLGDAQSARATVLVTYHADRLTREGANAAARIMDTVEGKGPDGQPSHKPVRLVDCGAIDSAHGDAWRIQFLVAAETARGERQRIVERNRATARRLTELGRWRGGVVPYGCRPVPAPGGHGKVLEADPVEAERLREMARRILRGDSRMSVVRFVNDEGWPARRAATWSRKALVSALTNDAARTHVFSLAESDALRAVLAPVADPAKRAGKPRTSLLSRGLLVCGSCGSVLVPSRSSVSQGAKLRYTCPRPTSDSACERPVTLSGAPADEYVASEYLRRFGRMQQFEPRTVVVGGESVDAARRDVEAAEAALLADLTPERMEAVQAARARLSAAEAEPVRRETVVEPTGRTIAASWRTGDWDFRAGLVSDALEAPIRVLPGDRNRGRAAPELDKRLVIVWRGEGEPDYGSRLDYVG